jgi:hypothetical protein
MIPGMNPTSRSNLRTHASQPAGRRGPSPQARCRRHARIVRRVTIHEGNAHATSRYGDGEHAPGAQ